VEQELFESLPVTEAPHCPSLAGESESGERIGALRADELEEKQGLGHFRMRNLTVVQPHNDALGSVVDLACVALSRTSPWLMQTASTQSHLCCRFDERSCRIA
jgi:hypothetical protein